MASRSTTTIAGAAGSVEIVGLRDFRRSLAEVNAEFPAVMKAQNVSAAEALVKAAKAKADAEGSTAAKVANESLRVSRQVGAAAVMLGDARHPYAFGAEFGAKRYRQFKPWRGNQFEGWAGGPGYFLFPSLREEGPAIIASYRRQMEILTGRAFPD